MSLLTTLVAVRGLSKTTPGFRRALVRVADKVGIDPSHLAAIISFESAGTFSPSERNPFSKATGLIQFMPDTARLLGTSIDALAAMTAERQLDFVQTYFLRVLGGRRVQALRDAYLVVFAPHFILAPSETVVFAEDKDGDKYLRNRALDSDGDGQITVAEVGAPVEAIYKEGLKHPPIVVMPAPAVTGSAAAFLLALAGIALWAFNAHQHERGIA